MKNLTPEEVLSKVLKLLPAKDRRRLTQSSDGIPTPSTVMLKALYKSVEENVLALKAADRKAAARAVASIVTLISESKTLDNEINKQAREAMRAAQYEYNSARLSYMDNSPPSSMCSTAWADSATRPGPSHWRRHRR